MRCLPIGMNIASRSTRSENGNAIMHLRQTCVCRGTLVSIGLVDTVRPKGSRANGTTEERPMEKTHYAVLAKAKAEQILLLSKGGKQQCLTGKSTLRGTTTMVVVAALMCFTRIVQSRNASESSKNGLLPTKETTLLFQSLEHPFNDGSLSSKTPSLR